MHKWSNLMSLIKKLSLEYFAHILVVFQGLKDFTYIAFKGLLCGNFVDLAIHHIEWTSFETFHASPNCCLLIRKLSLGHLWFSTETFLEFPSCSNNLPLSFILLNFSKFSNSNKIGWDFEQMIESDVKKLSLEYFAHILVVFQGLKDFTYIAFKGLLCGSFVDLAIHHIEWTSFETFHASPNRCLLIRKLSLGHLWFTTETFLEFPSCSNNLPPSFILLNFWKFSNSNKIGWDFAQMIESDVVDQKI